MFIYLKTVISINSIIINPYHEFLLSIIIINNYSCK